MRNGSIQSKKQDINENLKNYRKISHKDIQTSLFSEIDKKNVEELQSENRNYMKKKQSQIEYEEYDIYESSDKIDEEKIKKIGNLLTTMNMDNTESG